MPGLAPVGQLPTGRIVELPGRGSTYVVDSGPVPGAPTFVLLHGAAATGLMMWYPALEMMRGFGRVVVFDQRWHGQGISSPRFSLEDCADDVAAGVHDCACWADGQGVCAGRDLLRAEGERAVDVGARGSGWKAWCWAPRRPDGGTESPGSV